MRFLRRRRGKSLPVSPCKIKKQFDRYFFNGMPNLPFLFVKGAAFLLTFLDLRGIIKSIGNICRINIHWNYGQEIAVKALKYVVLQREIVNDSMED
ncbi:MAG: hypothetical protein K2K57_11795 [Oscillospiraceae bacterium]|nr:hypothetical protein [Oscillospiraceae bacterium]